jgi:AraC-like DNA-binding protein
MGNISSNCPARHRGLRARQLLGDPRCGHLTVSDIAYECGFSDLSYFNRAFRRRFEATPSDIRAEAQARARQRP